MNHATQTAAPDEPVRQLETIAMITHEHLTALMAMTLELEQFADRMEGRDAVVPIPTARDVGLIVAGREIPPAQPPMITQLRNLNAATSDVLERLRAAANRINTFA